MQYFHVKTDVLMERDLAAGVVHLLDKEGSRNVLVFADEHVAQHPAVAKMLSAAGEPGRKIELRSIPSGEPTTGLVNELAGIYRGRGLDMFVAIGGGSVLDLAKAVSALIENEGVIEDYQGTGRQLTAGVKKICIPTTAGTGCEISGAAVLINTRSAFKRGVVGPGVVPTYALLCAELGASLPVDLTVGCGMDAIVHAVESYVSPKANELTRLFSREAFLRLYETLPKVAEEPGNLQYREEMLLGSCLAGYAIDNASTGAAHGMSYGPGIHFHVPHGFAVAIFFPDTMEVNIRNGCHAYAELFRSVPGVRASGDDRQDALAFVRLMREYGPIVRYGKTLFDYGVKGGDIDLLAKASMQNTVAYATNPGPFTIEDSYAIYHKLLGV